MKLKIKRKIIITWNSWFTGSMILFGCMMLSALALIETLEPWWCIITGIAVIAGLIWKDLEVDLDS